MESPITHPLLPYAAYAIIAVALTWYLSRARGVLSSIKPGTTFVVLGWIRIVAALFFFGLPSILIYAFPQAAHPVGAAIMTLGLLVFCTAMFVGIAAARIEIVEDGLVTSCLGWKMHLQFKEYVRVSIYWYNIALERKDGRPGVGLPFIFRNSTGLYHYLKEKIEAPANQQTR